MNQKNSAKFPNGCIIRSEDMKDLKFEHDTLLGPHAVNN